MAEFLRTLQLTAPLHDDLRAQLARLGRVHVVTAGTVLFREGDEHRDLYLVAAGSIALEMRVPGRGQVKILSVGPGELLAWSALVSNQVMTATAIASEPTTLIVFSSELLRTLCESNHELGYQFMRQISVALSKRLVATRLQLLDLFADTTPGVFDPTA